MCKFLYRETPSSDNSVSSKSTEKILQDKDEENIKLRKIWNSKGVQDGLSNDIFYLLDKKASDNEKVEYICHCIPGNSFNYLPKQYKERGCMNESCQQYWLEKYSFLCYSKSCDHIFYLSCVLFPDRPASGFY